MNIKQYIWYKTEEKQTLKLSGKFTYRLILALVKLLAFIAKWILNNTSGTKQNKTKSGKFTYHLILALVKLFTFRSKWKRARITEVMKTPEMSGREGLKYVTSQTFFFLSVFIGK